MKPLREEQNERRKKSDEPPTLESMLRDLEEEAVDERTPAEQKKGLAYLLRLWRAGRPY